MAKFVQTKYKKFKKEIIGEGPAKCKPYPNRIVELVSERKLGFFVQIKEDSNFNHRNPA